MVVDQPKNGDIGLEIHIPFPSGLMNLSDTIKQIFTGIRITYRLTHSCFWPEK